VFLASLGRPVIIDETRGRTDPQATLATHHLAAPRSNGESTRRGNLILSGKAYPYHNAKDAMVIVLDVLAKGDPTFLGTLFPTPDAQGRKRRYIGAHARRTLSRPS